MLLPNKSNSREYNCNGNGNLLQRGFIPEPQRVWQKHDFKQTYTCKFKYCQNWQCFVQRPDSQAWSRWLSLGTLRRVLEFERRMVQKSLVGSFNQLEVMCTVDSIDANKPSELAVEFGLSTTQRLNRQKYWRCDSCAHLSGTQKIIVSKGEILLHETMVREEVLYVPVLLINIMT